MASKNRILDRLLGITENIFSGTTNVFLGKQENNYIGPGVSLRFGENPALSTNPALRSNITLEPKATILIKKKAFSTLKYANDLQWLDKTEVFLMRATKALFAFKVQQLRVVESLTKLDKFYANTGEINLRYYADLLNSSRFLGEDAVNDVNNAVLDFFTKFGKGEAIEQYREDILSLLKRHIYSQDNDLTTWIVDPESLDNYGTGPGTGVIELANFDSLDTSCSNTNDPADASFTLQDPFAIMNISEDDIEIAIKEALFGQLKLFDLYKAAMPQDNIDYTLIAGAAVEVLGFGSFDKTINMDYVRNQLRTFYLGKGLVNPADAVHIFIRGNRTVNNYAEDGNISGFEEEYLQLDSTILEAERILYTNRKLDFETYKKIRESSDNSFSMQHVFGGYVVSSSNTFREGSWSVSVNCVDNMGWLQWSRFMIEPALSDPGGFLEDPLTPYEYKVDETGEIISSSTQLLEENKQLLQNGLLSFDSGILNGNMAKEGNLFQGQINKSGSLSGARIMQHPQGLVYRWKTGILAATAGVDVVDPKNEKSVNQKTHNEIYGLTVAKDALNNLDIANVVSVLVAGQPYNVETFFQQALTAHNVSNQTSVSSLSQNDAITAVFDVVRKNNVRFGDFKPYRTITLSNSTLLQTSQYKSLRETANQKILALQTRGAKLESLIEKSSGVIKTTLEFELSSIKNSISSQINALQETGSIGSDEVVANYNLYGSNRTLPLSGDITIDHQLTRAMSIVGTRRRIEDVRLNRDMNLLMISDQYDENTDIRSFMLELKQSNYKIFNGQTSSVYELCQAATETANLEFFCNPDGHLELRPPQWNKTPLTVLQNLVDMSNSGRKVIPDFIKKTFETRSSSLKRDIYTINMKIVAISLLLGQYPDTKFLPFPEKFRSKASIERRQVEGEKSLSFFGVKINADSKGEVEDAKSINQFSGISSSAQTKSMVINATFSTNEDIIDADTDTLLGVFDPVFQNSNNKSLLETVKQVSVLSEEDGTSGSNVLNFAKPEFLNKLRADFKKICGQDISNGVINTSEQFVDADFVFNEKDQGKKRERILSYFEKLKSIISQRDTLVTILQRNKQKQEEIREVEDIFAGRSIETQDPNTPFAEFALDFANASRAIDKILTGDATKGALFDHLIEDNTRNFEGPGSGRRFVISDSDIISCVFNEVPPNNVKVDVVGNAPLLGENQSFEGKYFWAGATDFDLWRQYGFKAGTPKNIPFANSAESQCKPYAIMSLQWEKVRINTGTLTIPGNEYYRPGDNIYIPSKGLLYYVSNISHSFSIGSSFTTTLTLVYGHAPGNYLPSPLDVIGQQYTSISSTPAISPIIVYRNQQGDDGYRPLQPDSSFVFPRGGLITYENIDRLLSYKDNMVRFYNMMLNLTTTFSPSKYILIRGFLKNPSPENEEKVRNNIAAVKQLLMNPVQIQGGSAKTTAEEFASSGLNVVGIEATDSYKTKSLQFPNRLPVINISAENIMEQIVTLNESGVANNSSKITTINPSIISEVKSDGKTVDIESYLGLFPKAGPKQRSFLDVRSMLESISAEDVLSNIIEIGILDLNKRPKLSDKT